MSDAPRWIQLVKVALQKNASPNNKYVQLATVRRDGRPACRTVVFRGFHREQDKVPQLKFVTDLRSEKISQIKHQRWGEICWYFADSREQFRLLGEIHVITKGETDEKRQRARVNQWQAISDSARKQFCWPCPGLKKKVDHSVPQDCKTPDKDSPQDSFCLLLFRPERVDYLRLIGLQQRFVFQYHSATWSEQEVNP